MLKLVEIYEPVTTVEEVERENKAFRKAFSRMSDASLEKYIDDNARNGNYDCYYMMAWYEMKNRKERQK